MPQALTRAAAVAEAYSRTLNWWVERLCGALIGVMVLDVLFGILTRYVLHWPVTWTEELARYIMIWAALLAVSCGVHYREHIGLALLLDQLPPTPRRTLALALDLAGLGFFAFLLTYGIGMARDGFSQYATIFHMTMGVPFLSVPVSAGLAAVQMVLRIVRDLAPAAPGGTP